MFVYAVSNLYNLYICTHFTSITLQMFPLADQILLFVSAGRNTEGNPLEVIRDENEALQNRVIINTYGIGTGRCIKAGM